MPVPNLNFISLFVDNPQASGAFYATLLGMPPAQESPSFVMFLLPNNVGLGLWSRHTARPPVTAQPGGAEISFSDADVEGVYQRWKALGIPMVQPPTAMDGLSCTFLAVDPDGHRIRVFSTEGMES